MAMDWAALGSALEGAGRLMRDTEAREEFSARLRQIGLDGARTYLAQEHADIPPEIWAHLRRKLDEVK